MVTQLLPGKDPKVRCVQVRRPDKVEAVYTINKLYPLEINVTPSKFIETKESAETRVRPPKRRAALEAGHKFSN